MMKHRNLVVCLLCGLGPALADPPGAQPPDPGVEQIEALGTLNGEALACGDFASSKEAKALMIRHVPKSRRYGIVFESATNAAFIAQTQTGACPEAAGRSARLTELGARIQQVFPPQSGPGVP